MKSFRRPGSALYSFMINPLKTDHEFWAGLLHQRAISASRSAAFVDVRLQAMSDYGRVRSAKRMSRMRMKLQLDANAFLSLALWHAQQIEVTDG